MAEGFRNMFLNFANQSIDDLKVWLNAGTSDSAPSNSESRSTYSDEIKPVENIVEKTNMSIDVPSVRSTGQILPEKDNRNNEAMQIVKHDNRSSNFYQKSPLLIGRKNDPNSSLRDKSLCSKESMDRSSDNKTEEPNTGASKDSATLDYSPRVSYCTSSASTRSIKRHNKSNTTEEKEHEVVTIGNIKSTKAKTVDYNKNNIRMNGSVQQKGERMQYDNRKDSGISVTTRSSLTDIIDLPKIDEIEETTVNNHYYDNSSLSAQQRNRYRVTTRPFRNINKHETEESRETGFPKQVNSTRLPCKITPKVKISIQYFDSSKQLRVVLTDVMNLETLCVNGKKIFAKLCLFPGKRQQKKTKIMTTTTDHAFNDVLYFHIADEGVRQRKQLRIKLLERTG